MLMSTTLPNILFYIKYINDYNTTQYCFILNILMSTILPTILLFAMNRYGYNTTHYIVVCYESLWLQHYPLYFCLL